MEGGREGGQRKDGEMPGHSTSLYRHRVMQDSSEMLILFLLTLNSAVLLLLWPVAEATQTVQALQHPGGEGPISANKEVEIRSLRNEIDNLKKQIAGQSSDLSVPRLTEKFLGTLSVEGCISVCVLNRLGPN